MLYMQVAQMEALAGLPSIEIDTDDSRRSMSVIRTLRKFVMSAEVRELAYVLHTYRG